MDCGIPFCHHGCPLGNLIPEWNDLARRDDWRDAIERLHATNNFPEFTGKLCPAPCEGACVLNLQDSPGHDQADRVGDHRPGVRARHVEPQTPAERTGKQVAVVGSGRPGWPPPSSSPARARRHRLRAGRQVGGLLRYGIPEFKMEKAVLDRRLDQMRAEGTRFVTGSRSAAAGTAT
jgi:glutamate synthase (NADPH/NADH) small chain